MRPTLPDLCALSARGPERTVRSKRSPRERGRAARGHARPPHRDAASPGAGPEARRTSVSTRTRAREWVQSASASADLEEVAWKVAERIVLRWL